MDKEKKPLFEDASEMIEIFRKLPKEGKIAAIAYVTGAAGIQMESLVNMDVVQKGKTA